MAIIPATPAIQRTLIVTHPRQAEPRNLKMCTRLWELTDPVFPGGKPFEKRLSMVEEGVTLPNVRLSASDGRFFSWSGAIDDNTPPPGMARLPYTHISASEFGFAGPGYGHILLAGGNLDFCLFKTFESLVRQKIRQNEPLDALIPIALTYWSRKIDNPEDYIRRGNPFSNHLAKAHERGILGNYRITIDGQTVAGVSGNSPLIELNWFTVFKQALRSSFFPEISDQTALERVFSNFIIK